MIVIDDIIPTMLKSVGNTVCEFCPIKGTEHCYKVNPSAPKYTRAEKKELANKFKEAE